VESVATVRITARQINAATEGHLWRGIAAASSWMLSRFGGALQVGHESRRMDRVGKLPAMPVSALPEHVLHYRENNHDNGTDHAPEDRHIRHYCGLCTCFA